MKKVLHLRLDAPTYSSDGIMKGFKENGYEYFGLNWQEIRLNEGILGLHSRTIQAAKEIEPDLIFLHIQSPGVIDEETCQELSEIGNTVLYSFDVREDIKWVQDLAPYVDLILFADLDSVGECKKVGIFNVDVLQSSCDMDLYRPVDPIVKYDADIVFIGSNYVNTNLGFPLAADRLEMVNFLKDNYGDRFMCKGLNWFHGSESVNPHQERDIYNSAKIAICHNNFDRPFYNSDRIWRAMACGCMVLSKYSVGMEFIFNKEHSLDWWESLDFLKKKIDYYLANEDERIKIANTGCVFVNQKHTWANRIKELENIMTTNGIKPVNTMS